MSWTILTAYCFWTDWKKVRLLNNLNECSRIKSPVIIWGVFDGVHLGHRAIINTLVSWARKIGRPSLVITFNEHPKRVLSASSEPLYITSIAHRLLLLEKLGIDFCLFLPFTPEFSRMPAEEFINKILLGKIRPSGIVLARNTVFGRNKQGNIELLRRLAPNIPLRVAPQKLYHNRVISSTLIRQAINANRIKDAQAMLGRKVSILGTVVRGDRRGRELGFPTANLNPHNEILPPAGVYIGRAKLPGGVSYKALINIGSRPTFYRAQNTVIEAHLLNYHGLLYGKEIEVDIIRYLRAEEKFPSPAALIRQINADIKQANK
ncbi:MAG: riboflavin biosynthesis protein RibF [Planctomycetota bacterium]